MGELGGANRVTRVIQSIHARDPKEGTLGVKLRGKNVVIDLPRDCITGAEALTGIDPAGEKSLRQDTWLQRVRIRCRASRVDSVDSGASRPSSAGIRAVRFRSEVCESGSPFV